MTIELEDYRAKHQEAYTNRRRQGRMKSSWHLGVDQAHDGSECVTFADGLT